jgi:hypothetical protein
MVFVTSFHCLILEEIFLKKTFKDGQTHCFIETGCVPQTEGLGDFVGTRHNLDLNAANDF